MVGVDCIRENVNNSSRKMLLRIQKSFKHIPSMDGSNVNIETLYPTHTNLSPN